MIEINLLPGKRKAAKGAGLGLKLSLPDFRALIAQIKDPWLIAAAVATLLCGAAVLYYLYERTRLAALDARLTEAKAEKRRFDAYIAELRRAERLRDSLVAEIGVIRGIDSDRYIWPHVLDQVSKALPPYTWLVDVSNAGPAVTTPGAAPSCRRRRSTPPRARRSFGCPSRAGRWTFRRTRPSCGSSRIRRGSPR